MFNIVFIPENKVKLIYKYVCKSYNFLVTTLENIFFKQTITNNSIIKKGYFMKGKRPFEFEDLNKTKKVPINKYLFIYLPDQNLINDLISNIFNEEFRDYITSITGFKYSIDYMIIYDRKFIKESERERSTLELWYSYKWHFDKPNSNNTLKIIYPINITSEHGPLSVIDNESSKKIKNITTLPTNHKSYKFVGKRNKIYGFFPARCCHRDGIPSNGKIATQIMFQLNPRKNWSINCNLTKKKPNLNNKLKIWTNEPKFTFLTCMSEQRVKFKNYPNIEN